MIEDWFAQELKAAAAEVPVADRNPAVIKRARRRAIGRWLSTGVIAVALVAAGSVALGSLLNTLPLTGRDQRPPAGRNGDGNGSGPNLRHREGPPGPVPARHPVDTPESDQAAVFAARAIASAGLMDPMGYLFSFTSIAPDGDDWIVGYAGGRCGITEEDGGRVETCTPLSGEDRAGNAIEDSYVRVTATEDSWRVVSVDGKFPEEAHEELLAFSLPKIVEDPHWEYLTVRLDDPRRPMGMAETDGFEVRGVTLWVGPIPFDGPGTRCQLEGLDAEGKVVYAADPQYKPPAREEWERRGGLMGTGVPGNLGITRARINCAMYEGAGWETVGAPELDNRSASTQVIVRSDIVWRGEAMLFAESRCTASVYDDSGALMGEHSMNTRLFWPPSSLERGPPYEDHVVFTVHVGEPARTASADVSCELR